MTPQGRAMLEDDEGLRLVAYPDPMTRGAPWTIGRGHCGPEVHEGLVWTQATADAVFGTDIEKAETGLRHAIPWVGDLDPVRMDVLTNMAFNMGVDGLLGFHNTLAAVRAGAWKQAAAGMLASLWARQVQGRAYRLAEVMQTGAYS